MKRLALLALAVLGTSVSVACFEGKDGSPGAAGPPGPPGDALSAGKGAPSSSGGTDGASSDGGTTADASETPAAGPTKTGSISITRTTLGDFSSFMAMASFTESNGAAAVPNAAKCTTSKDGDCEIQLCDIPAANNNGGDPPEEK